MRGTVDRGTGGIYGEVEDRTHKTMSPGKMDGQTWQIALRRDKAGSGRGAIKARRWRRVKEGDMSGGKRDACESAKKEEGTRECKEHKR